MKTYHAPSVLIAQLLCEREVGFYLAVPWACPELYDFDDTRLVIETGVSASGLMRLGQWRFDGEVIRLHRTLAAVGVHHRDAHVANYVVVKRDGEPQTRLIDWEVAVWQPVPGGLSYDLDGPEATGIALPPQHRHRGYGRWWDERRREKYG